MEKTEKKLYTLAEAEAEGLAIFIDTETLTEDELYASDEEYQRQMEASEEAERLAAK